MAMACALKGAVIGLFVRNVEQAVYLSVVISRSSRQKEK